MTATVDTEFATQWQQQEPAYWKPFAEGTTAEAKPWPQDMPVHPVLGPLTPGPHNHYTFWALGDGTFVTTSALFASEANVDQDEVVVFRVDEAGVLDDTRPEDEVLFAAILGIGAPIKPSVAGRVTGTASGVEALKALGAVVV